MELLAQADTVRKGASGKANGDVIIAEWPLGREQLRVMLTEFRGCRLIDIRKWYTGDDDELRPGKSGISLQVKHLPQLADAVDRALEQARDFGLIADRREGAQ